jgi:DNA-directed RNA polymerase I, II, and III subunit RPABC2
MLNKIELKPCQYITTKTNRKMSDTDSNPTDDSSYMSSDNEELDFQPTTQPVDKDLDIDSEDEDDSEQEQEDEDEQDEDSDTDSEQEEPHAKITPEYKQNLIQEHYPEKIFRNHKEVQLLSKVIRDVNGKIVDPLHKTTPILTKYERARVLGERAKQIQQGSPLFIEGMDDVLDSFILAEEELKQKKIPYIIERPLPHGTSVEYWPLDELEIL